MKMYDLIRDEAAMEKVSLNVEVLYGFYRANPLPQGGRDTVHN